MNGNAPAVKILIGNRAIRPAVLEGEAVQHRVWTLSAIENHDWCLGSPVDGGDRGSA